MKIVKKENDILVTLPCGTETVISSDDDWIFIQFQVWGITGSKSKYVFVERSIKTEYSKVRERVYLHRVICKASEYENVDHIDRDRLNNRRSNLRICNRSENMANKSKGVGVQFKGVRDESKYRKLKKPFSAQVSSKSRGKRYCLGYFETAEEAARAYDLAAKEIWGEFAYLNFPD